MKTSRPLCAIACISAIWAMTKPVNQDLIGTECNEENMLQAGACCCEIQGADPRSGIAVEGRKLGEPDPMAEDGCTSGASSATCGAPVRKENWCADQAACNQTIICQEGKSCMSDFRMFGGCTCNANCAVSGTCCRECRAQCEMSAKKQNLLGAANSCASTCVGSPVGSSCSCAPSCVTSGTCCADYMTYCGKKITQFYNSLNKDRGKAITKNDLNFAVGRMLLGRQTAIVPNQRRLGEVKGASEKATQDGKLVANCLLEVAKRLSVGKVDPTSRIRTLDKTTIDVLCKATPLKGVKGRSVSVDEWEFLDNFCRLQDPKRTDDSTANLKVKTQVGLCRLGEDGASDSCTAIELAEATIIVGGEPNTDVLRKDVQRKSLRLVEDAKEMHATVMNDVCHESQQHIDKTENVKALQDIKNTIPQKRAKPLQSFAIQSFQELYKLATEAQNVLTAELKKIAGADVAIEAITHGSKREDRAKDEIAANYNCNWRQITDICRGTLRTTCGHSCKMQSLLDAYDRIKKSTKVKWQSLKNNWATPSENAYADLSGLVAVRTASGIDVFCELQLQLYDIEKIKSGEEHTLHEMKQQILRGANNAADLDKLKKSQQVLSLKSNAFSLYDKVWKKCFGQAPYRFGNPDDKITMWPPRQQLDARMQRLQEQLKRETRQVTEQLTMIRAA